jgi:spore germination cell wall hydrolase CwlJ-like protein
MSRVDDMVQLCGQIQAGHSARRELVVNLARSGAEASAANQATRKANQAANQERWRSLKERLTAYRTTLVAHENSRKIEAAHSRKARVKFVAGLTRNSVALARNSATVRKVNKSENAAARTAWLGTAASGKHGGKSSSLAE